MNKNGKEKEKNKEEEEESKEEDKEEEEEEIRSLNFVKVSSDPFWVSGGLNNEVVDNCSATSDVCTFVATGLRPLF